MRRKGSKRRTRRSVSRRSAESRRVQQTETPSRRVDRTARKIGWQTPEQSPSRGKSPRKKRDILHIRPGLRRDILRPRKKSTTAGLSPALVLSRRGDARQDRSETQDRTSCARRKDERRAVIIATGYGGINRAKDYRRQTKCR